MPAVVHFALQPERCIDGTPMLWKVANMFCELLPFKSLCMRQQNLPCGLRRFFTVDLGIGQNERFLLHGILLLRACNRIRANLRRSEGRMFMHRVGLKRLSAQAPLRTVRESFPSHGSSLSMDTPQSRVPRLDKPAAKT